MIRRITPLLSLLAGLLALAGPAHPAESAGLPPANVAASAAGNALELLFAQEWERDLREHPEDATQVGDSRYNDRWTDLRPSAIAAREAADRAALARLHAIDRAALPAEQGLNYDIFDWILQQRVERQRFREYLRPIHHKNGPSWPTPWRR